MEHVRALAGRYRQLALWLIAAALLVRAVVPVGYMLSWEEGGVAVAFCEGVASTPEPAGKGMAMTAHHGHHAASADHGTSPKKPLGDDMPCAFAATVSLAALTVDPAILALAVLFILATTAFGIRAQGRALAAPAHLRPPLRGPPARG